MKNKEKNFNNFTMKRIKGLDYPKLGFSLVYFKSLYQQS